MLKQASLNSEAGIPRGDETIKNSSKFLARDCQYCT